MEDVKVEKGKLLGRLEKNRNKHRKLFEEALEGWKARVIEELEKSVKDAKANKKFRTFLQLPQPVDHTSEYEVVIEQVRWSVEEQVELTYREFKQFVLDRWDWTEEFSASSASYSSSATSSSIAS